MRAQHARGVIRIRVLAPLAVTLICGCYVVRPVSAQTNPWATGTGGAIYYNGGNIGIGTTTPPYRLDAVGGFAHFGYNTNGAIPPSDNVNGGLIVGWNRSMGGAEVNFYNAFDASGAAATSFIFSQKTSPTTYVNLMTLMGSGNVGIGTTSPQVSFETAGSMRIDGNQAPSTGSGLELAYASNTSYVQSIQRSPFAWQPIQFNASSFSFGVGNVGIGTTAPQYKLAVNGTIGTKEVVVTNTGWADYVFKSGYRLRKLDEVGAYIRQHGRLPGIPSAKEVQEKGVGLGEMQVKLLAKIEELTLHMIEMEQQNRELRERIGRLEAEAGGGRIAPAPTHSER